MTKKFRNFFEKVIEKTALSQLWWVFTKQNQVLAAWEWAGLCAREISISWLKLWNWSPPKFLDSFCDSFSFVQLLWRSFRQPHPPKSSLSRRPKFVDDFFDCAKNGSFQLFRAHVSGQKVPNLYRGFQAKARPQKIYNTKIICTLIYRKGYFLTKSSQEFS